MKNVGHFTAMALRRDNPLCRRAAHLSRGVLGLAVNMRLVASIPDVGGHAIVAVPGFA